MTFVLFSHDRKIEQDNANEILDTRLFNVKYEKEATMTFTKD